ncbi:CBS domain-containing protein [Candidatus Bathyarchaeota archaeon]|nr:CBS domain-containing protein [Candidatus Bathyarchaeota archaeon]
MTVDEEVSVDTAAKIMGENRIGSVIVTREGKPVGIFTEQDLLTRLLTKDKPPKHRSGESVLFTTYNGTT